MGADNSRFITEAIDLSRTGMETKAGGPFGCVIVRDEIVIGKGYNKVLASHDPTAHAEIIAIRDACRRLNSVHLEDCILYTSSEPCPMCLAAIYWAHIPKVFYCNTRQDAADIGFDDSYIYEEISQTPENRKIVLNHCPSAAALQVFADWKNNPFKSEY